MARTKTTEMSTITAAQLADGDWVPVVDVSDTTMSSTGTNKKLAKSQLAEAAGVTAHLADTTDAHDASAISTTGLGPLDSPTTVQAALAATVTRADVATKIARLRAATADTTSGLSPTVTVPTANAGSTISSGVEISLFNGTASQNTLNSHGKFLIEGSPLMYRTIVGVAVGEPNYISGVTGRSIVSGYFYGQKMEWNIVTSGTEMKYRFFVDDLPLTAASVAATVTAAARYRISIDFGSAAFRKVGFMVTNSASALESIVIGPTDSWFPAAADKLRVSVLSDSFGAGTGTTNTSPDEGVWGQFARMGGYDVNLSAAGGTGFVTAGSSFNYADTTRLDRVTRTSPHVVLIQASVNDNGVATNTLTTAVQALIASLRASIPGAAIGVIGVLYPVQQAAAAATTNTTVIAAATGYADFVIDPTNDAAGAWVSGAGKSGSTTGSGNADIFLGSDGVHPTQAGHTYYGARIAHAVQASLRTYA